MPRPRALASPLGCPRPRVLDLPLAVVEEPRGAGSRDWRFSEFVVVRAAGLVDWGGFSTKDVSVVLCGMVNKGGV
jgi:hypothetical protein